MTDTLNLVYIGAKTEKKDTVYGTHLAFPAGIPIPVPVDVAYKFLAHPDVWVKEADYSTVKDAQEQAELQAIAELAAAEQARLAELARTSLMTTQYGDLGKLTSVKLKTIVESEGLELTMHTGEKVADFARRVRAALNEKAEG